MPAGVLPNVEQPGGATLLSDVGRRLSRRCTVAKASLRGGHRVPVAAGHVGTAVLATASVVRREGSQLLSDILSAAAGDVRGRVVTPW